MDISYKTAWDSVDEINHICGRKGVEMIRRSDPVPKPPPIVANESLNFSLAVIFLKGKGKS